MHAEATRQRGVSASACTTVTVVPTQAATCALLPPLFFLQFLFYTDIASVAFVMAVHLVSHVTLAFADCHRLEHHGHLSPLDGPSTCSSYSLEARVVTGGAVQALRSCSTGSCSRSVRAAEQRHLGSIQSWGMCMFLTPVQYRLHFAGP